MGVCVCVMCLRGRDRPPLDRRRTEAGRPNGSNEIPSIRAGPGLKGLNPKNLELVLWVFPNLELVLRQ